jgi:cytochrome c556
MHKTTAGLTLAAIAFTCFSASADPIADRKALMKENGAIAFKQLAPIAKGEVPFDATAANAALAALDANIKKFDVAVLFPTGTETGGETSAAPKIWEDMAGYTAAVDKYKADIAAAVAANPQDLPALQAQFGAITKNCGSCHEAYRIKKG